MTNHIAREISALCLIGVLALSPALSYAKNDDNKGNSRNNSEKKEKVEKVERISNNDNSCFRAFGHLFAPGFIKNWGQINFSWNCFLPFGISKKFRGVSTTTPSFVDTIPPIISKLTIKTEASKIVVTWDTNEKSDSTVFWSTSAGVNVNSSSTPNLNQNNLTKDHRIVIENLNASTTYFLVVRSRDASLNTVFSTETSFVTKALSVDMVAPTISNVTLLVGTSTINIGWKTNEDATSRVYYGTSPSLDVNASSTTFIENITLKKDHMISIGSLSTSTQYYLAVESKDLSGNRTVTPVFTATTGL